MAVDLATTRGRVAVYLMDTGNKIWDTGTLDEGLRQALGGLGRALGVAVALKDLDGAPATTLDGKYLDMLVQGAAGHAAQSRALDRIELVSIGEGPQTTLKAWADSELELFEKHLDEIRVAGATGEGGRIAAETAKLEAETTKLAAEAAGTAAKMAAETAKLSAEAARITAETGKEAAEAARVADMHAASTAPHQGMDWVEEPKKF